MGRKQAHRGLLSVVSQCKTVIWLRAKETEISAALRPYDLYLRYIVSSHNSRNVTCVGVCDGVIQCISQESTQQQQAGRVDHCCQPC